MAGEWIRLELALPEKPEFMAIMDATGKPWFEVQGWLTKLWGWFSLHSADGTAHATVRNLVRACGADEDFWRAVAAVGWLEIDEEGGNLTVPHFDRFLSKGAKSRALHTARAVRSRDRTNDAHKRNKPVRASALEEKRGEERRMSSSSSSSSTGRCAGGEQWQRFVARWNLDAAAGNRQPWKPAEPPEEFLRRCAEPGWLDQADTAIDALPSCRYFEQPVTLAQFVGTKFVGNVTRGAYENPKSSRKYAGQPQGPQPTAHEAARRWSRPDPVVARGLADRERAKREREAERLRDAHAEADAGDAS